MTSKPTSEETRERRRASIFLRLAGTSALFWLLHSFAVRNLLLAAQQAVLKLRH
jgi:hypothetical protein